MSTASILSPTFVQTPQIPKWIDRAIQVTSFEDLARWCEHFAIGSWIFRGVTDWEEHTLVSAIGRRGARRSFQGVDLPYEAEQAAELLHQFKLRARGLAPLPHDADDLEWLAVGRHHGLPTAFLDWTTSLLVAAFFVCQGGGVAGGSQKDGAIYAVKRPRLVETAEEARASEEPVAYFPPHVSPRITAQSGLLTFHPRPNEPWQPAECVMLWIPAIAAINIKAVLARAGINEASMVPGLDGIAAHLGWLYEREFLQQISHPADHDGAFADMGHTSKGGRHYQRRLAIPGTTDPAPDADDAQR